jgi:hypothetical protein
MNNLAGILLLQQQFAEAEAMYRQALDSHERTSLEVSVALANALVGLAIVLDAKRRTREAKALWARALPVCERVFGKSYELTKVAFVRCR